MSKEEKNIISNNHKVYTVIASNREPKSEVTLFYSYNSAVKYFIETYIRKVFLCYYDTKEYFHSHDINNNFTEEEISCFTNIKDFKTFLLNTSENEYYNKFPFHLINYKKMVKYYDFFIDEKSDYYETPENLQIIQLNINE